MDEAESDSSWQSNNYVCRQDRTSKAKRFGEGDLQDADIRKKVAGKRKMKRHWAKKSEQQQNILASN